VTDNTLIKAQLARQHVDAAIACTYQGKHGIQAVMTVETKIDDYITFTGGSEVVATAYKKYTNTQVNADRQLTVIPVPSFVLVLAKSGHNYGF
jgi:hypothetical protein